MRKKLKKIQTKKPNQIFSVSTLQKIRVFKKVALMFALPTNCKILTEIVSVSDTVIGEGTFVRVKVGHLNSLDLQCVVKQGKRSDIFNQSLEREHYRS